MANLHWLYLLFVFSFFTLFRSLLLWTFIPFHYINEKFFLVQKEGKRKKEKIKEMIEPNSQTEKIRRKKLGNSKLDSEI